MNNLNNILVMCFILMCIFYPVVEALIKYLIKRRRIYDVEVRKLIHETDKEKIWQQHIFNKRHFKRNQPYRLHTKNDELIVEITLR